jgi:hypothetical protein
MMDKPHMTEPLSATLPFALLLTLANSFLDSYIGLFRAIGDFACRSPQPAT